MKTIRDINSYTSPAPCVATIGFFDGVHLGHRHLINQVLDQAKRRGGMATMAVTFGTHPRQVVQPDFRPRLLTTTDEKLSLLATTGIDLCALLPFDKQMAAMSAHDFMRDVLLGHLGVRVLVTGYDNRFGHDRTEGFDQYAEYGRELGIEVVKATAYAPGGQNVSSSAIRRKVADGDMEGASLLLGRPYIVGGKVANGFKKGRELGFPTANIAVYDSLKLIPPSGAYAVEVDVEGIAGTFGGMLGISTRPTFGGTATTLEANIFGFSGDIYGRHATASFIHRMRPEHKFDTEAQLKTQLEADRAEAMRLLEGRRQPSHSSHISHSSHN